MRKATIAFLVVILAGVVGARAAAQEPKTPPPPPAKAKTVATTAHVTVTAGDLKWGPAPDSLPPGAQMAVVSGDPSKAGSPFVIRAKFADGYTVPPHFHPSDENVTVLSGNLLIGMGDKLDAGAAKALGTGGFARMPKGMHHFAIARGATEIQVHAIGPFGVTYVNPNDDPRKKTTAPAAAKK